MKYMGSKAKYADEILDVIEKEVHSRIYDYHNYIEPFVGGANIICETEKYNAFKIAHGSAATCDLYIFGDVLN